MKFVRRLLGLALAGVVFVVAAVAVGLGYAQYQASHVQLPPLDSAQSSVVLAADGRTELGHFFATDSNHKSLTDAQVSPLIRQAQMAAEDREFYQHGAISLPHMARALITDAKSGSLGAGGSTITQQYVKNAYLTQEKTAERKSKEIVYAYRVEKDFTKDEILTKYVNSNYYGRGAYGIEDAAKAWFGVSATKLRDMNSPLQVARSAFLAAIINQPSYYALYTGSPSHLIHQDALVARQRYVLDGLRQVKGVSQKVPQSVIDKAKELLPLKLTNTVKASGRTADGDPYVLGFIRDWLIAWQIQVAHQDGLADDTAVKQGRSMAEAMLARGGLRIVTSIDAGLQKQLAVAARSEAPGHGLKSGTVIMDPRSGAVVAMYGGSSRESNPYNYALYADRQVGSIMKTVVLADAVRSGISPNSVFAAPAYIKINGSRIYNDDRSAASGCRLTLAQAMAQSNNPVHVELITGKMASCRNPGKLTTIEPDYPVSPASVVNLARQMGADDSLVPGKSNPANLPEVPALTLGVGSMNPVKVATLGSTLANGGTHIPPHMLEQITAIDGKTVYQNQTTGTRVLSEHDAGVVNQVLSGVFASGGTAVSDQVYGHPLAGKTGTTSSDAWGLAYSAVDGDAPAYVCATWAGYKNNEQTPANLWGSTVLHICQHFFRSALSGQPRVDFAPASLNDGRQIGLQAERAAVPEAPYSPTPSISPSPSPTLTTKSPSPSLTSIEPSVSATESEATPSGEPDPSPDDSSSETSGVGEGDALPTAAASIDPASDPSPPT